MLSVLFSVVGGVAAGLIVGRRISISGTTLLALTLALPSAVIVAHQGWMWRYDGLLSLLEMASGAVGGLTLFLAAMLARTTGSPGFSGQPLRTDAAPRA